MADKKTKRDFFKELMGLAQTEEQKAFITHEIELLDKKHSSDKPTKAQEENMKVKQEILDALESVGGEHTISDIQKMDGLSGYSNQKISSLVKQLVDSGLVARTEVKRIAYFSVK